MPCVQPLAQDFVCVYESPDPQSLFCYTPGLARLESGRLVATCDLGGPGAEHLPGAKTNTATESGWWQGRIFTSDDGGQKWSFRANFPFMHARPFVAGKALYVLGHASDLFIIRSDDGGVTWSDPARLTHGQKWHQSACNVHYANGCVYLAMERRTRFDVTSWYPNELAPVLLRGRTEADLARLENWRFASELPFYEAVREANLDWFGVPFYPHDSRHGFLAAPGRHSAPMGWLESNVVQFADPDHLWHDPTGRTFHLWLRAHTGGAGYACVAKVVEHGEPGRSEMQTQLETVPSGRKCLFVPCPGGQMRFHVLFDELSRRYWLLSTQATDSMTRAERLPRDRFNLPNNERRRLQLHFSKNMIDWCFAGLVTVGPCEHGSRHYASMVIDGDDLCVLSRSGDERASCAHNGNLLTFHRVPSFRALAYC